MGYEDQLLAGQTQALTGTTLPGYGKVGVPATAMPNVAAQIQEIGLTLDETDKLIEGMFGRFGTILIPENEVKGDSGEQAPVRCELAERLAGIGRRLGQNNERLRALLRSCDL